LSRALEIYEHSGHTLSELSTRASIHDSPYLVLCLRAEKELLEKLIAERVERMLADGLVAEVQGLLAQGYASNLRPLQSIGYKEVISYLQKKLSLEAMRAQIILHTRQLAKRQYTWFRQFARDWPEERFVWLDTNGSADASQILKIPRLRERLHYY
jgi:tRNA dimethylallyltransferase